MNCHELRALRRAYGLTLEAMAERIGLSPRQYCRKESGESAIGEQMEKLIKLLF